MKAKNIHATRNDSTWVRGFNVGELDEDGYYDCFF
jgi:hypothetical protein